VVGGTGANVAETTRILGRDRVPAGFTITTDACVDYMERGRVFPDGLDEEVEMALARLERQAGKRALVADGVIGGRLRVGGLVVNEIAISRRACPT
jgi:pyruvate,orthophosphate dikinase